MDKRILALSMGNNSAPAPQPIFLASLVTGVVASRPGTGLTYTRATPATIEDVEGKITPVLSGETRHRGNRRVFNKLTNGGNPSQGNFSSAAWVTFGTKTVTDNNALAPDGTTTATTFASPAGNGMRSQNLAVAPLSIHVSTIYARPVVSGALTLGVVYNGGVGALLQTTVTLTAGIWQRIAVSLAAGVGDTGVQISILADGAGNQIQIWGAQIEDVTGQSNQNPSEYVSVNVLSSPFHGNFVDGVRYFQTFNGNTVAANIVTEAVGLQISSATAKWAQCPGVVGSYFATPSAAANQITGDIDIRANINLPNWTPAVTSQIVAKYTFSGSQAAYLFYIDTAGRVVFAHSSDGTLGTLLTATSSVAVGVTNGTSKWVRVTYAVATGAHIFYTSDNGSAWTVLGATVNTGATAIFASSSSVNIGSDNDGASGLLTGKVMRAQVYNGINGTIPAVDFNLNTATTPTGAWVSATTGETWTPNGAATVFTGAMAGGGLWDKVPAGYLPEEAGVQLVTPTASIRDLTNAAWTKTTMTTALTSIGADGTANSATRCTATAGNALVLQTLVAAASSRTVSFLIKRVTGTGNIELTQNNVAFTNINAELQAGVYIKVLLNASILNASFGIRIVTSGDAIDVDMSQFEAGLKATSRMLTTGAVRNADVLLPTFAFPNTAGTLYLEAGFSGMNGANNNVLAQGSAAEGSPVFIQSATSIATFDGTTTLALTAGSPSTTAMNRMSIAYNGTAAKAALNGTLGSGVITDGNYNIGATFGIGCNTAGGGQPGDPIRNLEIYNIPLTDAQQLARGA